VLDNTDSLVVIGILPKQAAVLSDLTFRPEHVVVNLLSTVYGALLVYLIAFLLHASTTGRGRRWLG
jgi:hypothetical protein